MTYSFDLTREPWIPCVMQDGEFKELGLYEALTEAQNIREISDHSPLVTASLHRLLVTILHRLFGPATIDEWADMWEAGHFDSAAIGEYLGKWRHRFDLFDAERPFYQTPGMPAKMLTTVGRLAPEVVSGNNPVLFDHNLDDHPTAITPAEAALLAVAYQAFATGGLCSGELHAVSAKSAPLTTTAVIQLQGQTLHQTLMLNLSAYGGQTERCFPTIGEDLPAWEQSQPASIETRAPHGYLDYLTWQSRRLWLEPSVNQDGSIQVAHIMAADGRRFPEDYLARDPMAAYIKRRNAPARQEPWYALRLREDRSLWRDSTALLQSVSDVQERPALMDWIATLINKRIIDAYTTWTASVLGLCSDRANIKFWRHEQQPIPFRYLVDDELVRCLGEAVDVAEAVSGDLRSALWGLAFNILKSNEENDPGTDVVRSLSETFAARDIYWATLEPEFWSLFARMADTNIDRDEALTDWAGNIVAKTAFSAFDATANGLERSARTLRAAVLGRRTLGRKMYGETLRQYLQITVISRR